MKNVVLILFVSLASACVTAEYGAVFDPATHGLIEEGKSSLVVYVVPEIEEGIAYHIRLNKKKRGLVFPGTFIRIENVSEPARLSFFEGITDLGANPETYDPVVLPSNPLKLISIDTHAMELKVDPGEVVYIRLRKEQREEFFECAETKDTTKLCSRIRHITLAEPIETEVAQADLSELKESL